MIGMGTLLFTMIWYSIHFLDYNELLIYKDNWKMARWQFPYYHYENDTVTIITRVLLSFMLGFNQLIYTKIFIIMS